MKEITAILALLMLLTGCGQSTDTRESPPTKAETSAVSTEEKMIITTSAITITAAATIQPTIAVTQETTIQTAEPVSTAEAAVSGAEVSSTDNTTQATETPQTTTSAATAAVTIPVTTAQQSAPPIAVTELLLPNDGTDYGKAKAVYEYMRQNGNGTCVNHACMTYKLCCDNGLQCCLAWTDAGMYGHVANIVNVDGIWYVLDTEGGYFLDYNYCFTEVVDIDGNHIADSSIISDMSYDELH